MLELSLLLKSALQCGASDIHLSVGSSPLLRVNGKLRQWTPDEISCLNLSQDDTLQIARTLLSESQYQAWLAKGEFDFTYSLPGLGRFRVNIYRQRGCASLAIRPVPYHIPALDELDLPYVVSTLAEKSHGLVLVTGPAGSGKSTTLAALINKINQERCCHIITIEDPIEYLHQHQKSLVDQRELGSDTSSVSCALRACLRQNPDVIMVSELRDTDTIATVITAAETGHLVFGSLHTCSAGQTVNRLIDVFPTAQQQHMRTQLAAVLQGIVTQQLVTRADGNGRVLAAEVFIGTPAARNLIREGKNHQIQTIMQTGGRWGMQTMDMALRDMVKTGKITPETAIKYSADPDNFQRLLSSI